MDVGRFVLKVTWTLFFAAFLPLQAKLPWVKKAQALGFTEITSCASCHSSDKPKKGDPLGERGKWLQCEKTRRNASEVDVAWLKDYPKKG